MGNEFEPLPGSIVFNALKNQPLIILAANPRINIGVLDGIFEAAKSMNSVVIFELAKSESNLQGGYTGLTPEFFAKNVKTAAIKADYPWFILHADHLTIQKATPEEISEVKELIISQIKVGFSSFAIDASFLFNLDGRNELEHLQRNIEVTTQIANFIKDNMKGKEFGLEVEVGEIGKKDKEGLVYTTVAEAKTYIQSLNKNGIFPHFLAIANGSTHGNIYDAEGNVIDQISINIPRTIEIAKAIEPFNVRIAQHGITGTPLELIEKHFPRGLILKGNVGTHWMNIVWDVLIKSEPVFYKKLWNWTIETFKPKSPKKADKEIFGENAKYGIKQFFNEINALEPQTVEAIKATAYREAIKFLKAFNSQNSVDLVKKAL
ncbi:MAG TPA: class II fructose-bisphosphate aldolase [Candidatus Deferrimicrobium sp.]|nr:class II fructose-bisphosphate aldolase [Candidatus Deferrimicrobium sp.]